MLVKFEFILKLDRSIYKLVIYRWLINWRSLFRFDYKVKVYFVVRKREINIVSNYYVVGIIILKVCVCV